MGLSGAESLSAVANIFVGMIEAPLMIRPYLERMTRSELFCVMTTGMATIAGSVLVAYAKMLGAASYAGHLVTASFLSAPAGMLRREGDGARDGDARDRHGGRRRSPRRRPTNMIDAAAAGAIAALRLAAYVGALLIAFVALIAMANAGARARRAAGSASKGLTFQRVLRLSHSRRSRC